MTAATIHDVLALMPQLRSRAFRWTNSREAAADLVQDTIERWLRAKPEPKNLRAWLTHVMGRIFIDQYRHRTRSKFGIRRSEPEILMPDEQIVLLARGYLGRQEDSVILNDAWTALLDLPPGQRNAILAALDSDAGTVPLAQRSVLCRGRKALRAAVEGFPA